MIFVSDFPFSAYAPAYGPPQGRHGRAYGHDLVGHFDHHTGPFGPFGFYANFFDEK